VLLLDGMPATGVEREINRSAIIGWNVAPSLNAGCVITTSGVFFLLFLGWNASYCFWKG